MRAFALVALLVVPVALAQVTDVPDLATATTATATFATTTNTAGTTGTTGTGTTRTTGGTTAATTGATTGAGTTAQATSVTAINPGTTSQTTSAATTGSTTANAGTGTTFHLSDLPTIQGAGIPTIVVPYTANAPFMQKSSLPEGTVFIAVGATLAFLGACVLLWRVLVAWSINRSVKRAAMTSVRGPEKSTTWGSSTRQAYQKEYEPGNSMSMDALTSSGKPIKSFRDQDNNSRGSGVVPPAGLFFSPTANAQQRNSAVNPDGNRGSSYLPAGYYASPSAQAAGGAGTTLIGSSLAPYARTNSMNNTPSPPVSPALPPTSQPYNRSASREGARAGPRALQSGPRIRQPSATRGQSSSFYRQSSASNLTASNLASSEHLAGQRAPSALLDDLFDQHGTGPQR
ncbi:uncharacterized protein K489DRAFT_378783 [Dissoconium aciculare CBS 342.82]|uniref:Mid2 domain-containing protein n=1 Tax=Dissoconium aciculare CBS 342.82 TaxID=1314786 RepID=A0A6J3M935_9PEZI|nr:uncharacterized protein K489DRAFT_378783 [Dissoconium aciculare CBS 342.82]KAF1824373.1 hypothetical protein K489DRAFT_378783 [Dissoconium aciculare CBS 342.82]